jgi:hypothetical protein
VDARGDRGAIGLKRRKLSSGETVALATMNTVVMIAGIGVFYAIVIHGLSINQMLAVVLPFALLAFGWMALVRRIFRLRRSS